MKRIFVFLILAFLLLGFGGLKVDASDTTTLDYNIDTYFRGVWVTPKDGGNIGNIKPTANKTKAEKIEDYKKEVLKILDIMEWYNLNALIFHIRIDNDAIYYSDMNPWSNWFTTYGVDPGWDPLAWVIEETHKRGIEFHAWMNPYRITASGKAGTTASDVAKTIPSYNIGSKAENLLVSKSSYGTILNPAIPEVREFIIDTCMEVIEKYDVDAIHFDDYFYITNVDDDEQYKKYNPQGMEKADWRRHQVDLFIEGLSEEMRKYNKENNRYVQLGISPSGIWKSARNASYVKYDENGNAITNGSATSSTFEHFGDYLYSDTLKWVNEEWIDYILPQTYWGISHPTAAFKPLLSWWDAVVKYKKVNLYSGMGIYMSEKPGVNYSWGSDSKEAYKQIIYSYELENTYGTVFYNFTYLKDAYYGRVNSLYGEGMTLVKNELFTNPAILPEVRTMERVVLDDPKKLDLNVSSERTTLTFDEVDGAKFYVIYRSSDNIDFSKEQVYKIISPLSTDGVVTFVDEEANGEKYSYGIKVLSGTNSLSEGVKIDDRAYNVVFKDESGKVLKEEKVRYGKSATAPTAPIKENATFVGWSRKIDNVTSDLEVCAKYTDSDFTVKFYDRDGNLVKSDVLKYQESATAPTLEIEGYNFISWSENFENVKMDLDIYPHYEIKKFNIEFRLVNPLTKEESTISKQVIKYGENPEIPEISQFTGYDFVGWSEEVTNIKKDTIFTTKYEPIYFDVTFVVDDDEDTVIEVQKVRYGENAKYPTPPQIKGMEFSYWRGPIERITSNRTVTAIYGYAEYEVIFKGYDGAVLETFYLFYEDEFTAPDAPLREGYTFIGWDKDFSEITSDLVITAMYKKDKITVTYFDKDGNEIEKEEVLNNGEEIIPSIEAPLVTGYTFSKWEKTVFEDGEVYFSAIYTENAPQESCEFFSLMNVLTIISLLGLVRLIRRKF